MVHQAIINKLYSEYLAKGYVSEDSVFDALIKNNLPLDEVDYVCDMLLSKGAIIRDDALIEPDAEISDRSRIDYNDIFDEVLDVDDTLLPFVNEIREIVPPQNREWHTLLPQAKNGNGFARTRIIEMYLRTVLNIALAYHKKFNFPLAETVQDGCLGLVHAIDKFDASRHDAFSTYAPWWIRQFIMRAAQPINPLIYYPVHVKDKMFSLYNIVDEHHCSECGVHDICPNLLTLSAEKLSCSIEEVQGLLLHMIPCESIDDMLQTDEDVFSDEGVFDDNVTKKIDEYFLELAITNAFECLKQREVEVLSLRFGFTDGEEHTLEEIGQIYNVTRERIRQIEAKALRKLSHKKRTTVLECFC